MGISDFLNKGIKKDLDDDNASTGTNQSMGSFLSGTDNDANSDYDSYTVQSGDSLSAIAKRFYGDAMAYTRIFDANRDQINDADVIEPGQTLKIPRQK